jgi:hypothetical protein
VPEVFAGKVGRIVGEQEYGDYKVQIWNGQSAWIATSHLTPAE